MTTGTLPFDGDDDALLDAVVEWFCDGFSWGNAASLPPVGSCVRTVGAVLEADFCIGEAGFQALIRYDNVVDLRSVVDSFVAIGATYSAACIQSAFDAIPDGVIGAPPANRRQLLPEPDTSDPIGYAGHLSFAYCEYSDAVLMHLVEYIRAHQTEFSALFADSNP